MKLEFKTQAYQTAAVQAVWDCFAGQPPATVEAMSFRIDPGTGRRGTADMFADGFKNAGVKLSERHLLENIQKVAAAPEPADLGRAATTATPASAWPAA
jgi:type III restriction enzyme